MLAKAPPCRHDEAPFRPVPMFELRSYPWWLSVILNKPAGDPVVQEGRFLIRFPAITATRPGACLWSLERRKSVCQPHRLTRCRFRRADQGAA